MTHRSDVEHLCWWIGMDYDLEVPPSQMSEYLQARAEKHRVFPQRNNWGGQQVADLLRRGNRNEVQACVNHFTQKVLE